MKRILRVLLALVLTLSLAACAEQTQKEETQAQSAETEDFITEPEGPSAMDEASMLLGQPVEELLTLVGVPERIEHYPSAMNEGDEITMEDGLYYYADFVVYTLKEGETELIYQVEALVEEES